MTVRRLAAAAVAAGAALLLAASPAAAGESGRIVGVTRTGDQIQVVFQADGLQDGVMVDPDSVQLRVAGRPVEATARQLSTSDQVDRTSVLAIDNSRSMIGDKFDAAKAAASTFLQTVPSNVKVGLVTFGSKAAVAVKPTTDHSSVQAVLDGLDIDPVLGTALFDAVGLAADTTGEAQARNVLLLTDGNQFGNSSTTPEAVIAKATDAQIAVDAVYIGSDPAPPAELDQIVTGAGGSIVQSDSAGLATVFRRAAEAIQSQLVVTAQLPEALPASGNVDISAQAGSATLTDSAFASFADTGSSPVTDYGPKPVQSQSLPKVSKSVLPFMFGAVFLGLLIILYVALSAFRRDEKLGRVRKRLSLYTLSGRQPVKQEELTTALGSSQVARSAVELAGKVVQRRDFEAALSQRLDAAGVPLRAAEWMLIHVAIAIGAALLLLLISGGQVAPTVLGLLLGATIPWVYLVMKESRRTAAFLAQLPDTLQLLAGSLSAGYSMPQAMDTVVREGQQPITGEFNRALIEGRLGVPIEDALDGVAERMKSKDFAWVVMAIRIQREVGGNLAELLATVSATLRERERLRRQVRVLSAEGRLSAWILSLLPLVFAFYLILVRPQYLKPLVSEAMGWMLIGFGVTLLAVGVLWMRKAVKVEV